MVIYVFRIGTFLKINWTIIKLLYGCRGPAQDTELEDGSMEGRYLEEEVQRGRGSKMGQSTIEEFFLSFFLPCIMIYPYNMNQQDAIFSINLFQ